MLFRMKRDEDYLQMIMTSYFSQYNSRLQYYYSLYDIHDIRKHLNILMFPISNKKFNKIGECLIPYQKNLTFWQDAIDPQHSEVSFIKLMSKLEPFYIDEDFGIIAFISNVNSEIFLSEDTTYAGGSHTIDLISLDSSGDTYEHATFRFETDEETEQLYETLEKTFN